MSIARIYTTLNNLIIRNLGDTGGPSSSRVDEEIDNIHTFINGQFNARNFLVGYPKCIRNARPGVGNVGAGLDTLESFNLPVGNLFTNGDFVDAMYTISVNTNDNDKRAQLTIGGTVVINTTLRDLDERGAIIHARVSRVSDVAIDVAVATTIGQVGVNSTPALVSSLGFFADVDYAQVTVADLDTNVLNFLLEAEATANNDLVLFMSQMHVTQMT